MWSQPSYPSLFFSPSHILSGQTVSSCPGEIQCSGHGVCSQSTYRCSCDIGWESGDCSEMACPMGPSWWDYDCILIDIQTVSLTYSLTDSFIHSLSYWHTDGIISESISHLIHIFAHLQVSSIPQNTFSSSIRIESLLTFPISYLRVFSFHSHLPFFSSGLIIQAAMMLLMWCPWLALIWEYVIARLENVFVVRISTGKLVSTCHVLMITNVQVIKCLWLIIWINMK